MLAEEMIDLFWDEIEEGFFLVGRDAEPLLVRPREWVDAAMPSGSSVAALMLVRLSDETGEKKYREISSRMLKCMAGELSRSPMAYTFLLTVCDPLFSGND